jgi:hypothetical protein
VATVSVYFHPARSAGSMLEAVLLAFGAFIYAAVVSFASMGVSIFFGQALDLIVVGHVVVLIVFCGGGLGVIGWLKQHLGNPLVNVACSLASLAIITIVTKEGAVQAAEFSNDKVFMVLKMVLMGVVASTAVSFLVAPTSARKEWREDLVKITDYLEEILTTITRGFLSGSEYDLQNESFTAAQNAYKSTFISLVKNLREARFEHYVLGTEKEHDLEVRLVKCIERLAQSLFGLRSAASTQFQLIANDVSGSAPRQTTEADLLMSPMQSFSLGHAGDRPEPMFLDAIVELPETASPPNGLPDRMMSSDSVTPAVTGAADIFSMFISQLGPSMKSLAFTLKGVLNELPFGPAPDYKVIFDNHFRHSLVDARDLFISSRREALETLYTRRVGQRYTSTEVAADYEEVAASCGHFSSSLEDFAEDTIRYLDILEELKDVLQQQPRQRSWGWMKLWGSGSAPSQTARGDEGGILGTGREGDPPSPYPNPLQKFQTQKVLKKRDERFTSVLVWNALRPLRREDIKYAIKVGVGAVLFAMFSFFPSTRPIYTHWRGEWGLLSYMLVCSMTIGASNTTGLQRIFGTFLGAMLAIIAWIIGYDNPFALGFLGWLVSLVCFYIILGQGKGPMGRFILLTYNLSALYAYSLSVKDGEDDEDEGGISPEIWEIVGHRIVSVIVGCIWGIIFTRVIWPISARRKVRDGTALLWLRMGLIWKRDPLQMRVDDSERSTYMGIRESIELQRYLTRLESLRASAAHEFDLRGPFPDATYREILEATGRMLGAFHAMSVIIMKDAHLKATPGEAELLKYTREERRQLSARMCHLFSGKQPWTIMMG